MNPKNLIYILIVSLFIGQSVQAQNSSSAKDTLWYLNGDFELISDYTVEEDGTVLNYLNRKGKQRTYETFYIFGISKTDGTQEIFYKPMNEDESDTLTVDEMQSFVIGGFYGSTKYKAPLATLEGFAMGVASPFIATEVAGASFLTPYLSIIIPALNTTLIGVTRPSERRIIRKYPELEKNKLFIEGFKESARRKRTKNSLLGGVVGLATGIFLILSIK